MKVEGSGRGGGIQGVVEVAMAVGDGFDDVLCEALELQKTGLVLFSPDPEFLYRSGAFKGP